MEIEEKEYQELKAKAKKWDDLEKKISSYYGHINSDGEWVEHEDENTGDLVDIGEQAAIAFGFM